MYYSSSAGSFMAAAVLLAIAATILAFIFIVPDSKREKLNSFGKFLHDALNFKFLIVEKILQALYIFATAFIILDGFFMLFQTMPWDGMWLGGFGILTMILGPIIIRLVYELLMMMIILVKHVISINSKLKNQNDGSQRDYFAAPDISEMRAEFQQKVNARKEASAPTAAPSEPVQQAPEVEQESKPSGEINE